MKCIRFIDLFAGIGGFRYGLEAVNNEYAHISKKSEPEERTQGRKRSSNKRQVQLHDRNRTTPFRCVYTNEWDKYAAQIYKKHYGECDTRDIRTVNYIPDHDLLCAGFPCQAFSIAGKRRGFDDTRGTLFFDIARILKERKPRLCLLENVKGLLSHDNGRTFKTIITTLVELRYDIQWQVLNSKNFGVPQNRERVFIIGHLGERSGQQVFPIREGGRENVREGIFVHTINSSDWRGANRNQQQTTIRTDKPNTQQERDKPNSSNRIRRTPYTNGARIRRLTPTECERLQGFPDGWTEGISDTQRYKCLGNAVTTNVVQWIGSNLSKE